ncbi:MAG TPA: ABC transporter permease [Allosphingosinicella sp.]|nr:ABC transporter permease [Allosphingosinicella sp.]
MRLWESAWVIARRDFVAQVFSRFFILFLLAPVVLFGFMIFFSLSTDAQDRTASQPVVAVVSDSTTYNALSQTRSRLVGSMSEQSFPTLRYVDPGEDVRAQAQALLADETGNFSGVFSGTLDQPVLTGPVRSSDFVGRRMQLLIEESRRTAALEGARASPAPLRLERVVTTQASGSVANLRRALGQGAQALIFSITLMLATLALSTLVEEKSNKIIEVLAASVPLESIFLGKLIAMLGISLVGLALWGAMLATAVTLFYNLFSDWVSLPSVSPGVGWLAFVPLLLLYYTTNFMLLAALFLGIGAQATSIREIQTVSMPVVLMQLMILLLAMTVVNGQGGAMVWFAYLFPLSSPMAMIALASKSSLLWPHLLALAWQALWVVIMVRLSSRLFRRTVFKSSSSGSLFRLNFWKKPASG